MLLLRGGGAGLTFFLTLVFARLLGPIEFGLYSLGFAILSILSVISRFGLDNVVLKQVAAHYPAQPDIYCSYIQKGIILTAGIGAIVVVLMWMFSEIIASNIFQEPRLSEVLDLFSFVLIPMSLMYILSEIYKGQGKPNHSVFILVFLPPLITLVFVFFIWSVWEISLSKLIVALGVGFLASLLVCFFKLRKMMTKIWETKLSYLELLKQSYPMLLVSSISLFLGWSDMIILGIFSELGDIGIYSVATRVALVTTLVLLSVNTVVAPKYASLYKKKAMFDLKKLSQKTSKILFGAVLVPTCICLFFPEWVMGWFGDEYASGAFILIILVIGQFVNVLSGSVRYLLTMTGGENKLRRILFYTALMNIILSVFFVRLYGSLGVASATSISLVTWNIWATIEVRKHLGFWPINLLYSANK
ncbi:MAG: hypothetical protein AXW14_14915 [Alteromonas sp. Nap_26]|nr:MAG: hypothetical protein AXW14_14915 [Alteromonas sp. Nap_26]